MKYLITQKGEKYNVENIVKEEFGVECDVVDKNTYQENYRTHHFFPYASIDKIRESDEYFPGESQ